MADLFAQMNSIADKNNAWSAQQAQKQMDFQASESQKLRDFNANEAKINRDWQEMMSNSAHQREIADLKKAGLNPVLSAGGQGASVTSGSTASQGSSGSGAKGDTDTSLVPALASMAVASINSSAMVNAAAMQANASMANAKLNAQTQTKIKLMDNLQRGIDRVNDTFRTFHTNATTKYGVDKKADTDILRSILGIIDFF